MSEPTRRKPPRKKASAGVAKRAAAGASRAAAGGARAGTSTRQAKGRGARSRAPVPRSPGAAAPSASPDPEGFFVARVRGEDAMREAPHPMLEPGGLEEAPDPAPGVHDEALGELPWSYGEDALVALPRDPRTLFVYWDHGGTALAGALAGLEAPRAQLWLFVKGAGWERLRVEDCALEARGWYLHGLEPGRHYRVELHLVDRHGVDRLLPGASAPVGLPSFGPSPVIDDRFVELPWDLPLPRLLGPGSPARPIADELRAHLARLSDWGRFPPTSAGGPPGAGGMGGRPTSWARAAGGSAEVPPTSPAGPWGGEGR